MPGVAASGCQRNGVLCCFFVHVPLNRALHKFARAAQRQFFFDVRLIRFDGFDTDMQFFGNLPGPVTFADQTKDFQFTVAQIGDGGVSQGSGAGDVVLQHPVGNAGR